MISMTLRSTRKTAIPALLATIALVAVCPIQGQEQKPQPPKADTDGDGKAGDYYRITQSPATQAVKPKNNYLRLDSEQLAYDDLTTALAGTFYMAQRDPADETLGATLVALSDALRSQLKVPAGQGLIVSSLRSDGPSAQAGLKQHDVLLTLADHPLTSVDDLSKHLKAAGEAPVPLKLLRGGKKVTLQVRPVYRVTLGWVGEEKKEFYIGVSLSSLDEALRTHLNLPAGQGVLVDSIVDKSPAATVGIKPHDIILEFAGAKIDAPEKLAAQVQAAKDQPVTLKVLREGRTLKIEITPAARKVETSDAGGTADRMVRLWALRTRDQVQADSGTALLARKRIAAREDPGWTEKEASTARQIEDLRAQVQSLRDAVERLNATLKANQPPKK
jgi:C-terminal processing protease CtpA/Prc